MPGTRLSLYVNWNDAVTILNTIVRSNSRGVKAKKFDIKSL